jgi:hypothetical protein
MKSILLTLATAAFIVGRTIVGQEQPDFSGTWVMDMSRSETPAQGAEVSPRRAVTLVIKQEAEGLVIERQADGRVELMTYSFKKPDLIDQPVGTSGPDSSSSVQQAFASWQDGRLETLTILRINGQAVTRKARHSLDSSGREMTVTTEMVIHHGYETRGGADPASNRGTVKDVYIRRDR